MTEDSKRWKNRTEHELSDFLGRFNEKSISELMRIAVAAIQRLRDDGRGIWIEGSDEDRKWQDSCNGLWHFLTAVEGRKRGGDELSDVLREFVSLYEHSEARLRQLLFQKAGSRENDPQREQTTRWLAFIFRACTYAILAVWFDYKRETVAGQIHVRLSTGEVAQKWTHKPMQGTPRKHRRSNG